jgi:hypothetical protein
MSGLYTDNRIVSGPGAAAVRSSFQDNGGVIMIGDCLSGLTITTRFIAARHVTGLSALQRDGLVHAAARVTIEVALVEGVSNARTEGVNRGSTAL